MHSDLSDIHAIDVAVADDALSPGFNDSETPTVSIEDQEPRLSLCGKMVTRTLQRCASLARALSERWDCKLQRVLLRMRVGYNPAFHT